MIRGALTAALVFGCCLACDSNAAKVAEPAPSVTMTPSVTPSAKPVRGCTEDADAQPGANQFTVSWLVFSGREDPSWKLTAAQSRELRARILGTKGSARGLDEMTGQLGSIGYIVRASSSQDEFLDRAGLERHFWVPTKPLGAFLASTMPCSAFP